MLAIGGVRACALAAGAAGLALVGGVAVTRSAAGVSAGVSGVVSAGSVSDPQAPQKRAPAGIAAPQVGQWRLSAVWSSCVSILNILSPSSARLAIDSRERGRVLTTVD